MTPYSHNDITTDTNDHVRELQQYLRIIRREQEGETDVPVDGRFGELTAVAVRQVQQDNALPITGAVDRATWDAIFAVAQQIIDLHALPVTVRAFRMEQPPLRQGDRNNSVMILQAMLYSLKERFSNLPSADMPTGIYSKNTADAVRILQQSAGLATTGIVDKLTWDAITTLYNEDF